MKLSFIGDICLARQILMKYQTSPYQIVDNSIINLLEASDFTIANLESPITKSVFIDGDHLNFRGLPQMLDQFKFVNCFSLSNNHINDCGTVGMGETIISLEERKIPYNGLFEKNYEPFIIHKEKDKIAVVTCTDMMNIPFEENSKWKTLHIDSPYLDECIKKYKSENFCVILYAHVGMLFTRYVNPPIRKLLYEKIDLGADIIVTAHAHCLGGMEFYKNKPIFHSIGDFVMDGGSFRRRRAAVLNIVINDGIFESYDIVPTEINKDLVTVLPAPYLRRKMLRSWNKVTMNLKKYSSSYSQFFKKQYKKEMLFHTLSTLNFLIRARGFIGMVKFVFKRMEEVKRTGLWFIKNRSNERRDDDAILDTRKRFTNEDLYK